MPENIKKDYSQSDVERSFRDAVGSMQRSSFNIRDAVPLNQEGVDGNMVLVRPNTLYAKIDGVWTLI